MTEREIKNLKKLVRDQLTLFSLNWDEFRERLGKEEFEAVLNAILDKKIKLDRDYPHIEP